MKNLMFHFYHFLFTFNEVIGQTYYLHNLKKM